MKLSPSVLLVLVLGCSSSPSGDPADSGSASTCPNAPDACVKPVPSYRTVIEPIIQNNCATCHSPKGGYGYDESTYAQVYAQYSSILSVVGGCTMPPSTLPSLPEDERQALLDWLVCEAPNN
jgi:mono/diheme cytochrome c family protein